MADGVVPTFWTADYCQDSLQLYVSETENLAALLLLNLEEEGDHRPFIYTEDEMGGISYQSLVSDSLILNYRSFKVVNGIYHESIIDDIVNTIPISPWEPIEYEYKIPEDESWRGLDSVTAWYLTFPDPDGEIVEDILEGNCFAAYVSSFYRPSVNTGRPTKRYGYTLKRIVYSEGEWDAMGMASSEKGTFSGGTYVQPSRPEIANVSPLESIWGFVTENALGIGPVIILIFILAIMGFLKRIRQSKKPVGG